MSWAGSAASQCMICRSQWFDCQATFGVRSSRGKPLGSDTVMGTTPANTPPPQHPVMSIKPYTALNEMHYKPKLFETHHVSWHVQYLPKSQGLQLMSDVCVMSMQPGEITGAASTHFVVSVPALSTANVPCQVDDHTLLVKVAIEDTRLRLCWVRAWSALFSCCWCLVT
eukprot:877937-Amphidinium_carterae.1